MSPQAYERAKRALRTSLGREAANVEAVYTKACISERRVSEAGGPKRTKRARTNSRRESPVGEAGGHQPVWVRARLPIHYLLIAINKIFELMRLSTNYSLVL